MSSSAYLHILKDKHGLVAVRAGAIELDHIPVIADRLQDLNLLQVMKDAGLMMMSRHAIFQIP